MEDTLKRQVSQSQSRVDELLKRQIVFTTPANQTRKRLRHNSSPDQPAKNIDPAIAEYIDSKFDASVAEYIELIKDQQKLILSQQKKIEDLETQLAQSQSRQSPVPDPVSCRMEQRQDDLEQYSRRNTLRLTGVKETVQPGESTDTIALKVAAELGVPLTASDLDRSHFNSPPDSVKGRELLIKFVRHNDKVRFISQRKKLRDPNRANFSSVYINEDLTRPRYKLLRSLIKCKQSKNIHAVWSYDGNIFFKKSENSEPIKIKNSLTFNPETDI